jgi:hypothetical protein
MSPGYRCLSEPPRRGIGASGSTSLALCSRVRMSSGRCDLSPGYRSARELPRRRVALSGMFPASRLGRLVATLLALARMVPWFHWVCGGREVWTDLFRSKSDSGRGLGRGGGDGGSDLFVDLTLLLLLNTLLLLLMMRRNNGWSSGSSLSWDPERSRRNWKP